MPPRDCTSSNSSRGQPSRWPWCPTVRWWLWEPWRAAEKTPSLGSLPRGSLRGVRAGRGHSPLKSPIASEANLQFRSHPWKMGLKRPLEFNIHASASRTKLPAVSQWKQGTGTLFLLVTGNLSTLQSKVLLPLFQIIPFLLGKIPHGRPKYFFLLNLIPSWPPILKNI